MSQYRYALLVLVMSASLYCASRPGRVTSSWETAAAPIRIRVLRLAEEHGGFVSGAYYRFQATIPNTSTWRDVITFRHDDPVEIPKDQVRVQSDRIAYFFMGWAYAVTTDGGASWSIWNAEHDLPGWQGFNYRLINDVRLESTGTGTMSLNVFPGRAGEIPALFTNDFGKHWSARRGG